MSTVLNLKGTLSFNRFKNGAHQGRKTLRGLIKIELKQNVKVEKSTSKDKDAYGQIVATIPKREATELSFSLQEFDQEQAMLVFMGDPETINTGGGVITAEALTAKLGCSISLAHKNLTAASVVVTKSAKGTGDGYTSSAAGFAIGVTSIPVISGTGTILAGDAIQFAGDTVIYKVATGVTAPGTITLVSGLEKAIPAAATALTIITQTYVEGSDYEVNYAQGWITALAAGAITEALALKVDYDYGARAGFKINAETIDMFRGEIFVDAENLADGSQIELLIPSAAFVSSTALDFMSDKPIEYAFTGAAEKTAANPSGYSVTHINNA